MITRGLQIDATPEQIIELLRIEAQEDHVSLFARTKSLQSNMQFSCPFHSGGQERKPSCGMSRDITYKNSRMIEAGTVHCFTCGYTGDLQDFVSAVKGRQDGGRYGNQWLKKHFLAFEEVVRSKGDFNFDRRNNKANSTKKLKYVSEKELESYRFYHSYMFDRGLNEDVIDEFDVGFSESDNCITFPIRDLQGNVVFIYKRGVKQKFHKYGEDDNKTAYIYGLYELYESDWDPTQVVYIVESVINALTLRARGYYAVSTMGLGGGEQYDILIESKVKRFVIAFDPDKAGMRATKIMYEKLKDKKLVSKLKYPMYMYQENLDLNDERNNLEKILLA